MRLVKADLKEERTQEALGDPEISYPLEHRAFDNSIQGKWGYELDIDSYRGFTPNIDSGQPEKLDAKLPDDHFFFTLNPEAQRYLMALGKAFEAEDRNGEALAKSKEGSKPSS